MSKCNLLVEFTSQGESNGVSLPFLVMDLVFAAGLVSM